MSSLPVWLHFAKTSCVIPPGFCVKGLLSASPGLLSTLWLYVLCPGWHLTEPCWFPDGLCHWGPPETDWRDKVEKWVLILRFAPSWWVSLGCLCLCTEHRFCSSAALCIRFFLRTPVISGVSPSVFMPLIYCTLLQVLLHCTYTLLNCLQINPLQFFRNL